MTGSSVSRRQFLCTVAGCAVAATLGGCDDFTHTEFFQKHFRKLSPEELRNILERLEEKYSRQFGKEVEVAATPPRPGVEFAYALDISRCVGCRRCVTACVQENNQSRDPQIQWIRVLEMDKDRGIDFEHANPYYDAEEVPREGHFYVPVACQQCRNPPCVKSCPVGATWQEKDHALFDDLAGLNQADPQHLRPCRFYLHSLHRHRHGAGTWTLTLRLLRVLRLWRFVAHRSRPVQRGSGAAEHTSFPRPVRTTGPRLPASMGKAQASRSKAWQTLPLYGDYGLASRVHWLHYARGLPEDRCDRLARSEGRKCDRCGREPHKTSA